MKVMKREKYSNDLWLRYTDWLKREKGYELIYHNWFMMNGIQFSGEICLDHLMKAAKESYIDLLATQRKTIAVSSSIQPGLQQDGKLADISFVVSARMTLKPESLVLSDGGFAFLQDGMAHNRIRNGSQSEQRFFASPNLNFTGHLDFSAGSPDFKYKLFSAEDYEDYVPLYKHEDLSQDVAPYYVVAGTGYPYYEGHGYPPALVVGKVHALPEHKKERQQNMH